MSTHDLLSPNVNTSRATTPSRRVIATFTKYADAERAVDKLADGGFPVERVAIIARGLQFEERITGRMNYGIAALRGAGSGAAAGFLIGWLFGLFDWVDPIISSFVVAINGLWFGAIVGAIVGMIAHALTRGRRDFSSLGTMTAERYDVLADDEVADEAAQVLGNPA
jgi:hypothetical protein